MRRVLGAALALLGAGCAPQVPDDSSIVSGPEVLAVQATPAEGPLGATFVMTPLYVDANGARDASGLDWAMCLRQKPLGDPGPIDPGCFADTAPGLQPLGTASSVTATIPQDACQLFGPDSPPPQPGQPSARPTDPDTTGGFYLPVRVKSPEGQWFAVLERVACAPSGLTQSVYVAFTDGYQDNANPSILDVAIVGAGGGATPIAEDGAGATPTPVGRGQHLAMQVDWPACSGTGPCGGAEDYIAIDPITKQLDARRESMVASWFATTGAFDVDRSGRAETDLATNAANGWTAPATAGLVHMWVVLRDARGGVGWASLTLDVQ